LLSSPLELDTLRDPGLARDADLAEAAAVANETVGLCHVGACPVEVRFAGHFVVSVFRQRPDRAAIDALPARAFGVEEAVGAVLGGTEQRGTLTQGRRRLRSAGFLTVVARVEAGVPDPFGMTCC